MEIHGFEWAFFVCDRQFQLRSNALLQKRLSLKVFELDLEAPHPPLAGWRKFIDFSYLQPLKKDTSADVDDAFLLMSVAIRVLYEYDFEFPSTFPV